MYKYMEKWFVGKRVDAFVYFNFSLTAWGLGANVMASRISFDVDIRIGPVAFGGGIAKHYNYGDSDEIVA